MGHSGYLRAKVCSGVDGDNLADFAKNSIAPGSLIRSDGLPAYKRLGKGGFLHEADVFDHKGNPNHLKWLHTLISNAKAFIAGTYHGLDGIHLQAFRTNSAIVSIAVAGLISSLPAPLKLVLPPNLLLTMR